MWVFPRSPVGMAPQNPGKQASSGEPSTARPCKGSQASSCKSLRRNKNCWHPRRRSRVCYRVKVSKCLSNEWIDGWVLQMKVRRLEHLLQLKNVRIDDLSRRLQQAQRKPRLLLPWARQKRHPLESGHRARTSCLLPEALAPGATEGCLESPSASTCSGRTLSRSFSPAAAGSALGTISRSPGPPCAESEQAVPGLSRFPPCPELPASPPPASLLSCSHCWPEVPVQAGASSGQDVHTRG
ncbi:sperm flagellar protein 1 isoform X5 [Sminthopsis crassicaudata]|uniref:sperm flagellar protein 1 isoform X5 n=1 Tax=Sminthopsis crassicaudata TaxID=9301 RepID=UPI003D684D40